MRTSCCSSTAMSCNDKETERKGEADLILAKHRNGPTDTVVVTFQGQYSRFFPMAPRSM